MALPPTRIHRYISTPERTFARLSEDGLLRDDVDEVLFIQAMRDVEVNFDMPPGMVGPNIVDQTVMALGPFLNDAGQELAWTPLYQPGAPAEADAKEPGKDEESGVRVVVKAVVGLTLTLAVPVVIYLGLVTALGVRRHPEVTRLYYVLGLAVGSFMPLLTRMLVRRGGSPPR